MPLAISKCPDLVLWLPLSLALAAMKELFQLIICPPGHLMPGDGLEDGHSGAGVDLPSLPGMTV